MNAFVWLLGSTLCGAVLVQCAIQDDLLLGLAVVALYLMVLAQAQRTEKLEKGLSDGGDK